MSTNNISWAKPISLDFIPSQKGVSFSAVHQSAVTQYIQIIDSNNKPIGYTVLGSGGQPANFPISGKGNSGFPRSFSGGFGFLVMEKGYQIQFGIEGKNMSPPEVAWAKTSNFKYGGGAVFGTEDSFDNDYNDGTLSLQWFDYKD